MYAILLVNTVADVSDVTAKGVELIYPYMVPEQSSQSDRVIRLSSEQAQKAEELSHEFIGVREDDVRAISEAAIDEFYEKYAGVDIEAALSVHAGDAQE